MNWYIVEGSKKTGPYNKNELRDIIIESEAQETAFVLSERMMTPMSYSAIFTPSKNGASPAGLPSLPPELPTIFKEEVKPETQPELEVKEEELPVLEERVEEEKVEVTLESEPVLEERPVETQTVSQDGPLDFEEDILSEVNKIDQADKKKRSILLLLVLITLGLIAGAYFYLKNYTPTFVRPNKMSLQTFKEIQSIHKSKKLRARVFVAKDKSVIWLGTNNYVEGQLRLSLDSIDGRVLSKNKIKLYSKAYLKNGLASFKNFLFDSGEKLVDGEYMLTIENKTTLKSKLVFMLKDKQNEVTFRKKNLISNFSKSAFETKLKGFKSKIKRNKNIFSSELIQKYLTLKTIVEQIRETFLTSFSNSNLSWRKRAQDFEQNYKVKFGPFFTSFVIANEEQYTSLNEKQFDNKIEIISDYTRLSRIAKSVGLSSVDVMDGFESFEFKSASVEEILKFKESSLKKFDGVIEECQKKIDKLNSDNL